MAPPLKAISTLSLGSYQYHSMRSKLEAAALSGFTAIDLFDSDWEKFKHDYAVEHNLPQSIVDGDHTSIAAAKAINSLCATYNLKLLCLQPFREFEARLDPNEATQRMHAARGALSILPVLGCDMLLIPSTTLLAQYLAHDIARVATELGELADYAASLGANETGLKICYEALSWGTFINTWRHAWEVVKLADRPNLGLCLDSFNTVAREWADPYHPSGIQQPSESTKSSFKLSLRRISELPPNKIFYFQVADGTRMIPPLIPPTDITVPPLRPWSRSSRLFPLETSRGAYLPIVEFAKAVISTGYDGPWALEVFNDSLNDPRPEVPFEHAIRGIKSLEKLLSASEFESKILPASALITSGTSTDRSIILASSMSKRSLNLKGYTLVPSPTSPYPANSLNRSRSNLFELLYRMLFPPIYALKRFSLRKLIKLVFRPASLILFFSAIFLLVLVIGLGSSSSGLFIKTQRNLHMISQHTSNFSRSVIGLLK